MRWGGRLSRAPPTSGYLFRKGTATAPQSNDASVGIDRLVFDGLRAMTLAARLQLACEMTRAAAAMTLAGLRLRYPNASELELHRRRGARRLGRELTLRTYGPEAEAWLDGTPSHPQSRSRT